MTEKNQLTERFGTCSKDCYGSCVFVGTWNDQAPIHKLVKAKALKNHPFTQGFFCPKFTHREKLLYDQTRLIHPEIRTGEKGVHSFESLSYNKAKDLLITKIHEVIQKHGPESILLASYSGNQGLISTKAHLRMIRALGGSEISGGICNEGGIAGLASIFGNYTTTNPLQLQNSATHLIVVWCSDISNNNLHAYTMIRQAQKRGAVVMVVDSRKTKIAEQADYFFQPRPNADAYLVGSLLKLLMETHDFNDKFLKDHVSSPKNIIESLDSFQMKDLLHKSGLELSAVEKFKKLLVTHRNHTIINVGFGLNKDFYGGRLVRAVALLQIFLGNFGKPGTGLIYSQSGYNKELSSRMIQEITLSAKYPPNNQIEIIKLAEALESGRYKLLLVVNFNPASSLPNQARLRKALLQKDVYTVVCDVFHTETTKYADLVFPMKYDVETNDLVKSYYIPGISITQAGPCPYVDCKSNQEFFFEIGRELGRFLNWPDDQMADFTETDLEIVERCLQIVGPTISHDIRSTGYHLFHDHNAVFLEDLVFPTPSGKIELDRVQLFPDITLQPRFFKPEDEDDEKNPSYLLITPSHPRFLHSQLGSLNKSFVPDFSKIYISEIDSMKHGFTIGEKVRVFNRYAEAMFIIAIKNSLQGGVALIYSGGPIRQPNQLVVNFFTPDIHEELGRSGAYNSAMIKINRL